MKKFVHALTLAFFLYLVPLLICLEKDQTIAKSIEELNAVSSASNDKFVKSENKNSILNSTNALNEKDFNENEDQELKEFNELTNFFEINSKLKTDSALENKLSIQKAEIKSKIKNSLNSKLLTKNTVKQSYDLYRIRKLKMRRKKEIIVKKVFEIFPLVGEVLGLADVEKIHLILNKFFFIRETDLLFKYITMWDTNVNFTQHSAKVLLNLLLCNSRFNKLRCILNLLMEGLCKGDPRSIRIFKEIVITVIIDAIIKTNFKYFNDIQAKFNLVRLFNVGFVFPPIVKIQFLEKMLISEKLKEMITFMILKYSSKEEIEIILNNNVHQPVPTIIDYNAPNIKHDERMLPKFLALKEKIIKAGINQNNQMDEKEIEEYYNLENLLKENKIESNNNEKTLNQDIKADDKDDVLSLASDNDPDYDSDLFSENENKSQHQNLISNPNLNGNNLQMYNHFAMNDNKINNENENSSIRKILPKVNINPAVPAYNLNIGKNTILSDNLKQHQNILIDSEEFTNIRTLSRNEALKILDNIKLESDVTQNESIALGNNENYDKLISNKYLPTENSDEQINYLETKLISINHLPYNDKQKVKLSEIKEQIKNEYNQMLYNMTFQPMPELEEYIPHFQIGISKRTIYPKYKKHLENLLRLNDLLDEFPISLPKGSIDVSSPNAKEAVIPLKPIVITKNVNGVNVSMQFKEKEVSSKADKNENLKDKIDDKKIGKESNINEAIKSGEFRFKSLMNSKSSVKSEMNICLKTTKENDFATRSFEQLANFRYSGNPGMSNSRAFGNRNNFGNSMNQNLMSSNNYNDDPQNNNEVSEITENVGNTIPEIKNIVRNPNKNIKVLFPKEIHTSYQVTKHGTKTIEINKNNPTKKLIIERLIPEDQFDDIINQQEKPLIDEDPTGLYNVLKNIQNRKCSCGFLCIEIGTIYGDFSQLNPRNITVPYNTNQNVHFVIKPIVIVNNTVQPPPDQPFGPIYPNPNNSNVNITNWGDVFLPEDDCEELRIMGVEPPVSKPGKNNNPNFNRFKETSMSMMNSMNKNKQYRMKGVNFNRMQRKFYRKVAIAEEIYSQDTFKQGLNMIIIQRDSKYTKLYERTFDTNNSRKEADELADILRDTPCSKIIVLTGIGKWMGAMTPALMKEIKQIGGPDLNNLYSPDEDDNSLADHAFILIGRRGLCRYNGIFRIKNYDITRQMQKLFPDLSSDPNDCYFEDVGLENQKNKLSEKQFFHLIDLRLTLNINNDNRFAWDAPTVSQVSPFQGSIHGGQEVKIGGFNFGSHTTDLKEILIGGVICGDFINLSPNLISCVTRASTILGPGPKNIVVKLRNGYESPCRTCNVFEYVGDPKEALDDLKSTINTVNKMRDLPIYMNSNYHDQDVSLFDHLKFNNRFYKPKLKPDHSNHISIKLDNMVKANYNELIDVVNGDSELRPKMTGLRRRRYAQLMTKLENCDKK